MRYAIPKEGTVSRAIFDALHEGWCNADCEPTCERFMQEWLDGQEFTADEISLIIKVVENWNREREPKYISHTTGGPMASGGPFYHVSKPISMSTVAPVIPSVVEGSKWEVNLHSDGSETYSVEWDEKYVRDEKLRRRAAEMRSINPLRKPRPMIPNVKDEELDE